MQTFDVLVVGGGPAGASCAGALRQHGLSVLLIDRAVFPRDKVCAGWITPAVVDALGLDLAAYGRKHVLQPFQGFRTGLIGGAQLENRYPSPVSYGIRRVEFDHHLLLRAGVKMQLGVTVRTVVGDITTEVGRTAALAACPQVDILVNNAGGPPPGDFRDWTREAWIAALDANMLTPIELMKATVDAMADRGYGRVVNITSAAVKAPIDFLGLSNGARSGLTGFVAGMARQPRIAGKGVTINNILPGSFDTDRLKQGFRANAGKAGVTPEELADRRRVMVPAQRFGTAAEFGELCAFVCSLQAGYLTGQNLLIDGGAYPGTY